MDEPETLEMKPVAWAGSPRLILGLFSPAIIECQDHVPALLDSGIDVKET
jgi:hypothetical protein